MPERLTDAQIDELLALEAAITEGPWDENEENGVPFREVFAGNQVICDTGVSGLDAEEVGANNRFIAASRNSIRSLLEEVRERRAAEMEILRALRSAESHYKQSENCGVCHPIGDCPTLRVISAAIARAEKES